MLLKNSDGDMCVELETCDMCVVETGGVCVVETICVVCSGMVCTLLKLILLSYSCVMCV